MKTYKQRTESILRKTKTRKRKRALVTTGIVSLGLAVATFGLVLFLPYNTAAPSVEQYKNSEYYAVIKKLNDITYKKPAYKNNFEKWTASLVGLFSLKGAVGNNDMAMAPEDMNSAAETLPMASGAADNATAGAPTTDKDEAEGSENGSSAGEYEETTDNQVQGVIEADLLKRTDKYAFYLTKKGYKTWNEEGGYYKTKENGHLLRVYSIAGADSELVTEFTIGEEGDLLFSTASEMYLSQDATRLTVICPCYTYETVKEYKYKVQRSYTAVVSLDIGDVTNVTEVGRTYLSGAYVSSRLVNGELLVINSYSVANPDFDDESTFLPQYGDLNDMQSVAAEDVVCSDIATTAKYTVVSEIDEKTLEVTGSAALLSYSQEVYVSETNLFLTQSYVNRTECGLGKYEDISMTEISCVSYAGEGLEVKGTFSVEGTVKNQYSMDEYEGVLRVATTYRKTVYQERVNGDHSWFSTISSETNANLYCIGLTDFQTVGKVEKFAPENETVESVRFNGTKAYVCTAVVITLTDPVFAFDLSDMSNITWTDTGVIDGYSTSLVDFGDGYLVGVGYNDRWQLKIEVYVERDGSVESAAVYELDAEFSESYKSYLIDRKNGLIGLGVTAYVSDVGYENAYLVLTFEDGRFTETALIPHEGTPDVKRAFYEDGYLYLFGAKFKAVEWELA